MLSFQSRRELCRLIGRAIAGNGTAADGQRLNSLLLESVEARQFYYRAMALQSELSWGVGGTRSLDITFTADRQSSPEPTTSPAARNWQIALSPKWISIAASLLLVSYFVVMAVFVSIRDVRNFQRGDLSGSRQNHQPLTVATICDSEDVRWSQQSLPRDAAVPIAQGEPLKIDAGRLELKLNLGVLLVVEGPAEWSIDGDNSAKLVRGRIVAKVPTDAIGFALDTPTARIIDLGTEFGVEVDESGAAKVQVFSGAVTAQPLAAAGLQSPMRLAAGEAAAIGIGENVFSRIPISARSNTGEPSTFAERIEMLGYFPFEGNADDASGNGRSATIVSGVTFVEGRSGKVASFVGDESSYIDLPIDVRPEACSELTWGAWVRPRSANHRVAEILSTDNDDCDRALAIDDRAGIVPTGEFRFAAFAGPKLRTVSVRRPLPSPGEWAFIAATYRQPLKLMALYVEDRSLNNGEGGLVSEIFGDAEIGPSLPFVRVGNRAASFNEPFAGEIDDVFLIRGALSHRELESVRAAGTKWFTDRAAKARTSITPPTLRADHPLTP